MFVLEDIQTKDGFIHQGLVAYPQLSSDTVLIWVHGLTGTFYGNSQLIRFLASESTKNGYTFATFNSRGHDMISGFKKVDENDPKGYTYATIGAGYEVFEESTYDLDSQILFFRNKGYKKIILLGHSSGANKVSYYAGLTNNEYISGVVLLCPMSDRLDPRGNSEDREENLKKCHALVEQGRGNALVTGIYFFPMTAERYISLVSPNTSEDQFDYGDKIPNMEQFKHITCSLLVLFAENDEYADRPVGEIKNVFDSMQNSSKYLSKVIPNSLHNLANHEESVMSDILTWMRKIA